MSEPGGLWRRQDGLRRQDEHRHETMEAIWSGDTAWALRYIAGPDAAIDHLQAMSDAGTTWEPDDTSSELGEPHFPHRVVTTIDELLGNVASTPSAIALRCDAHRHRRRCRGRSTGRLGGWTAGGGRCAGSDCATSDRQLLGRRGLARRDRDRRRNAAPRRRTGDRHRAPRGGVKRRPKSVDDNGETILRLDLRGR